MDKRALLVLCTAATTLLAASVAQACGDKLSVIGGGVSFDRVSQHRGNVVMLVEPNSSLRAANDDLKLRQALEYAGNKVSTVETSAELTRVLDKGKTDVVLVSWSDAVRLQEQMVNRSGSPTVLPRGLQDGSGRTDGRRASRASAMHGPSNARTGNWSAPSGV